MNGEELTTYELFFSRLCDYVIEPFKMGDNPEIVAQSGSLVMPIEVYTIQILFILTLGFCSGLMFWRLLGAWLTSLK